MRIGELTQSRSERGLPGPLAAEAAIQVNTGSAPGRAVQAGLRLSDDDRDFLGLGRDDDVHGSLHCWGFRSRDNPLWQRG